MTPRFRAALHAAWIDRRDATVPRMGMIVGAAMAVTLCVIALGIAVAVVSGRPLEQPFVTEHGSLTVYSALQLAAAGVLALAAGITMVRTGEPQKRLWFLFAAGFLFLSVDELLQFHERVGSWLSDSQGADSGRFRNFNDVIVIGYGLIAVPVLLAVLPGLLRSAHVVELYAVGLAFYALHTAIDSAADPPTSLSRVLEESCKLYCGTFLMLGSLAAFMGALWRSSSLQPARRGAASTGLQS